MGLFDKMFGSGAAAALRQPNAQQRFEELKMKYQSVLNVLDQQQVQLQSLHVQDNKLFIKGTVASEDARDKIWNQIKLVDSGYEKDLACDISFEADRDAMHGAGGSW